MALMHPSSIIVLLALAVSFGLNCPHRAVVSKTFCMGKVTSSRCCHPLLLTRLHSSPLSDDLPSDSTELNSALREAALARNLVGVKAVGDDSEIGDDDDDDGVCVDALNGNSEKILDLDTTVTRIPPPNRARSKPHLFSLLLLVHRQARNHSSAQ